jgi:hypothetical protein
MQASGIESAIRELEREAKNIQEAIQMLKRIYSARSSSASSASSTGKRGGRRRLSASARKRISEAAKRRWALVRSAKSQSGRGKA